MPDHVSPTIYFQVHFFSEPCVCWQHMKLFIAHHDLPTILAIWISVVAMAIASSLVYVGAHVQENSLWSDLISFWDLRMHRAALILTRQSLFVFSFLHLLTVAGYHFGNWNQMGPLGPRCIFSLGHCMFANLTHKYSCVCHASDFLARTTRACFLSYLFCASTTRWWDAPRLSSALFPATCCLLILTPASRSSIHPQMSWF